MEFQRRGVMLVLASPSGAGKSSISRALFEDDVVEAVMTAGNRRRQAGGTGSHDEDVTDGHEPSIIAEASHPRIGGRGGIQ